MAALFYQSKMAKIGFGGGCHWCTEAVFQSIGGVEKVAQGWISSFGADDSLSEAVLVDYIPETVSEHRLIQIHLHTHSATSNHQMRQKYRSAVYFFSETQGVDAQQSIEKLQVEFDEKIITRALPFHSFKLNEESFLNYYNKNPEAPFCKRHIIPKLKSIKGLKTD